MKKEMLINALLPEETRIAIIEDGVLEELYTERVAAENIVGNIYKGRIVNLEPSIQAVFVDFGIGRNGFLHISDVDPSYYETQGGLIDQMTGGADRGEAKRQERGSRGGDSRRQPRDQERARDRSAPDSDEDRPDIDAESEGESSAPPSRPRGSREQGGRSRSDDRSRGRRSRGGGGRRSRRDDRGRSDRAPAPPPPESLPDLEDYRIEEDEEIHEEIEAFTPPEPIESIEPEPEAPDDLDPFGHGLFDDDDDEPPIRDADAVYRKTGPEEDDFGEGLFEDAEGPSDVEESFPTADEDDDFEQIRDEVEEVAADSGEGEEAETDPFAAFGEEYEEEGDDIGNRSDLPPRPSRPEIGGPRGGRGGPREDRGGRSRRREGGPSSGGRGEGRSRGDRTRSRDDDRRYDEAPRSGGRPRRSDSEDRGRDGGRGRGGPRGRAQQGRWVDPRRPKDRPPIQEVFRRGQEVVVQVIKEGVGNKGPTLSTYISIPGRCLVAMPGLPRVGVSRKIEDLDQRRRLKDIMNRLERPEGLGFIVRTAGVDRSEDEFERDLAYLARLWDAVVRRVKHQPAPTVVYQESDVMIRTIRDIFNDEIDTIWIDEKSAYDRAREFMRMVMPDYVERIRYYEDSVPMFNKFHIEEEINRIQQRTVPLERGGSIVIEQTEALVAIDVNSGNFRADDNAEQTAFQMNMAAAKEIARQLRLRDLGGVIVNDFIDMREERHRRAVENLLRDSVRRDRARTKILRMSAFGLVEMTRQRIRPSLKRSYYRECPTCSATGHVKTVESMAIECMRLLIYLGQLGRCRAIRLAVDAPVEEYIQNFKRRALSEIEERWRINLSIAGRQMTSPEDVEIHCYDAQGNEMDIDVGHLLTRISRE